MLAKVFGEIAHFRQLALDLCACFCSDVIADSGPWFAASVHQWITVASFSVLNGRFGSEAVVRQFITPPAGFGQKRSFSDSLGVALIGRLIRFRNG